jgi:hypothetical protein
MNCDYDGREITGEPFRVRMKRPADLASAMAVKPENNSADMPEIGYRYFHDKTCYELFVADEAEYEALDLPGSQIG